MNINKFSKLVESDNTTLARFVSDRNEVNRILNLRVGMYVCHFVFFLDAILLFFSFVKAMIMLVAITIIIIAVISILCRLSIFKIQNNMTLKSLTYIEKAMGKPLEQITEDDDVIIQHLQKCLKEDARKIVALQKLCWRNEESESARIEWVKKLETLHSMIPSLPSGHFVYFNNDEHTAQAIATAKRIEEVQKILT